MKQLVRLHDKNGIAEWEVESGTNLFEFLRGRSASMKTACGGKGTCGKCRIKVSGLLNEPSGRERALLGSALLKKGYRLACYNSVNADLDVFLEDGPETAKIVTEGKERKIKLKPLITKKYVILDKPDIYDQRSDIKRVAMYAGKPGIADNLDFLKKLPDILRQDSFNITMCEMEKTIICVEPGDTTGTVFGLAVDVGTTTIAAYLVNLRTGEKTDVYSVLNPQKKFGADVISRIDYTMESGYSLEEMNKCIIDCVNDIIGAFTKRNRIDRKDIYAAVFVGNTTMMHFLMNLPANGIAVSPFIPVTTELHRFRACDAGIDINPFGYAVIFPSVSAYIGADTVAAVLSSGIYKSKKISLMIDIGTNGEMVLGNSQWLVSCSTAAGPAFEGANIRNGMGGVSGAIDSIEIGEELVYTTIGNEPPIGICGSGVVDAVAGMLSRGIIDETGRILDAEELENSLPDSLRDRLVEVEGKNAFLIEKSENCGNGMDIAITQKDVREIQNAKAAIAAGIKILVKHAGIKVEDIDRVYLAGGFGNYINIESALKIGLIPGELKGKIESIGNAAGAGAVEGLLSSDMLRTAGKIKDKIEYIELSACQDFTDEYVECMLF